MEWIKASERLSDHMQNVIVRKVGFPSGNGSSGYYDWSRKVYMVANMGPQGWKPEEVEWLDESAIRSDALPDVTGDKAKVSKENILDMHCPDMKHRQPLFYKGALAAMNEFMSREFIDYQKSIEENDIPPLKPLPGNREKEGEWPTIGEIKDAALHHASLSGVYQYGAIMQSSFQSGAEWLKQRARTTTIHQLDPADWEAMTPEFKKKWMDYLEDNKGRVGVI